MGIRRTVLAAAGAAIAFCVLVAPALAQRPASPPPIGDSCLVGRWVETKQKAVGDYAWNGHIVAVTGFAGVVVTFSADGIETDDFGHDFGHVQNLVGDDNGHQLQILARGDAQFHVRADGALFTESALLDNVGFSYIYDGQPIQGGAAYPPRDYTYRCTATRLHRETAARVAGYGPTVDDLVRASVAGSSGSVVSTVSTSLPTPTQVLGAPATLLVSALIALAAVLLITFPSHLFNRTYEENHEVIRYWWERRFRWLLRLRLRAFARSGRGLRDALGFFAVVLCGGVLAALLDPGFGLNLRTAALFAGAVFALLAGSLISFVAAASYRLARETIGPWHLHALPSGLLVAAACVLVSRVSGFQPGYLYGLIGGVVFARTLGSREQGHVVAVTSIVTLAVAVGAWLVWVPVSGEAVAHPASFGWALASNFLAAVFVSGMVGLLIGLVPLRFLPGEKLAGWHRGVWGAVFGLAALSVVEVMLRPQSAGVRASAAPLLTTAVLFVAFGVASVTFWAYFRVRNRSAPEAAAAELKAPHR